jgi:hypothetical protein
MKRLVNYHEKMGVFNIQCDTCPLNVHADALGVKRPDCVAGMATKVQGHIPIHHCEHYSKNSLANEPEKKLSIQCGKEDAP